MYRVFSCHFSGKASHFPCLNLVPGHHRRLARSLATICIFARVRIFGTFSRLARSLATIYIFARVRIIGTLVPFLCNREFLRISYYTKRDGTQLVPGLSTVSLFLTAVRHAGPDQPSVSYTFLTFLRISQKSNVAK